ncbi:hypothetical protein LOTGIDRAFT_196897 [Lottia gigantea]|uniref:Mitochondrial import inner membrane translocase subunit n=1 Tax=Lottia gigantea TaxID=225164 RepID=V3Z0A6_LOTGI|nr:hypothetical protein LOTGIDRAFT_196897 [Lottia gigantea]ESO83878.1 hypothetical protein LOTGIDRAFT_196897 [Lottia gigantea]
MNDNTRNMRDFLLLYNQLTEQCFDRCVYNMSRNSVSNRENDCISMCADRYVAFNQKTMHVFVEYQNMKQQVALNAQSSPGTSGTVA